MGVDVEGFKLKNEKGERLQGPTAETKSLAVIKGAFAPTTLGHESILDAAKALGFSEEDFAVLVGSDEAIKRKILMLMILGLLILIKILERY